MIKKRSVVPSSIKTIVCGGRKLHHVIARLYVFFPWSRINTALARAAAGWVSANRGSMACRERQARVAVGPMAQPKPLYLPVNSDKHFSGKQTPREEAVASWSDSRLSRLDSPPGPAFSVLTGISE